MSDESVFNDAMKKVETGIKLLKEANPGVEYMNSIINNAMNIQLINLMLFDKYMTMLRDDGYSDDDIIRMLKEYEEKLNSTA